MMQRKETVPYCATVFLLITTHSAGAAVTLVPDVIMKQFARRTTQNRSNEYWFLRFVDCIFNASRHTTVETYFSLNFVIKKLLLSFVMYLFSLLLSLQILLPCTAANCDSAPASIKGTIY